MAHILGHLHRHAAVIDAHQRQLARPLQVQQRIHAGTQIEHALEAVLLFVDQLLRWSPDHGIVGLRGTGLPLGHMCAGQGLLQPRDP